MKTETMITLLLIVALVFALLASLSYLIAFFTSIMASLGL